MTGGLSLVEIGVKFYSVKEKITKNLSDFLPEKISNEEAYNLVSFFMNLALELESYYFVQLRHCVNGDINGGLVDPEYIRQNDLDDEFPF